MKMNFYKIHNIILYPFLRLRYIIINNKDLLLVYDKRNHTIINYWDKRKRPPKEACFDKPPNIFNLKAVDIENYRK